MKRLSSVLLLPAFILLGLSTNSFASYFLYLKESGTTPITEELVTNLNDSGSGTLIVPPDALGGAHPELVFFIPGLVTSQVFLLKPGTKGLPDECLDQGVNHVGVGENAIGAPIEILYTYTDSTTRLSTVYTLKMSVNALATTSPTCEKGNVAPVRLASIEANDESVSWSGSYHLYNPLSKTSSIPEPSGLALLGLGLSALVMVKRRKSARH